MANFGEEITYWYLRLNGFFPLRNFVLHRGHELEHSADSDLVAVRFPHTREEVGGKPDDWDRTFQEWGFDLARDTVGLIVEVKTGSNVYDLQRGVRSAFSQDRVHYAVKRLGMVPSDLIRKVTCQLSGSESWRDKEANLVIAKLLVTLRGMPEDQDIPRCYRLPLESAEQFIYDRVSTYSDPKREARLMFPSDLLQYVIWKCERGHWSNNRFERTRDGLDL